MGVGMWFLCDACGAKASMLAFRDEAYQLPEDWVCQVRYIGKDYAEYRVKIINYYCSASCRLKIAQAEIASEQKAVTS